MPAIRLLANPGKAVPEKQLFQALHEPFDLEHEVAVRWYVIEQGSCKLVYLVSHHIALDGVSLSLLSSELFDILGDKGHCSSQLSDTFSQAHFAEVSGTQHCYAYKN